VCGERLNGQERTVEANVKWTSGMAFEGHQDGFVIGLDADRDFGGQGQGPKPKTLLLTALGGCTAMDVVSILKKMQVDLAGFEVQASGELTEDHPKVLKSIHLKYVFKGSNLPLDKLQRAVALSQDKYCGVSAMLAKACPITHEIVRVD
jgi:putative redox protein